MRTFHASCAIPRLTCVFKSFDKVTLLYEGHQIYFGPTSQAVNYFLELGFRKPARATTADFLTSITNPAERLVIEGFEDRVPRSAEEFGAAWKRSAHARTLVQDIAEFNNSEDQGHLKTADALRYDTYKLVY